MSITLVVMVNLLLIAKAGKWAAIVTKKDDCETRRQK